MPFLNNLWAFLTAFKAILIAVFIAILSCCAFYFWPENEIVVEDQRVIITGSSSGIGEELAYAYSRMGANILITARREVLLDVVRNKCLDLGAKKVILVPADMGNATDRARVVRAAQTGFDGQVDVLILNHALIRHFPWNSTAENLANLRQIMEINFLSYAELASATMEMLKKANGRIGFISSTAGKIPQAGFAPYSAAKFALDGFFSALRIELRLANTNVSVTNCLLGLIGTEAAFDSIRSGALLIDEAAAAPVNETAMAILKSVHHRERELFYPKDVLYQYWRYRLFPVRTEDESAQYTFNFV